jgi:hypothetical protein
VADAMPSRVARFFLAQKNQNGKKYHNGHKSTNGHKINQNGNTNTKYTE